MWHKQEYRNHTKFIASYAEIQGFNGNAKILLYELVFLWEDLFCGI